MTSPLIKCTLVIALSGFLAACSSNPKPAQPEIAAATPPPPPPPVAIIDTPRGPSLTLDDVLFDFEQATLRPEADQTIAKAVSYLQQNPDRYALVEGHTDHTGDADFNQQLSDRRSDSIEAALVSGGISPQRITTVGFGELRPIASNDTPDGRQANRRVEIIFKDSGVAR